MQRIVPLALSVATWLYAQPAAAPPRPEVFDGVDVAVEELSRITGLEPLKKVATGIMDRAGLKQFLEERIREEVKPEEIRVEELALKRFGLVPADFDLKRTTIDLLTEQAAAFYDFHKKKLFVLQEDAVKVPVAAGMAKEAQAMIVVHELAHALADQHFNLEKFIKRGRSDDASTARMAVMEGQATWLMMEVMAQRSGQSLTRSPVMVELMGAASRETMLSQYPVLSKAPLYIQASLLFPYTSGLRFQNAVVEKQGKTGFSQVFQQPPASTQQIMHPERYLAREDPLQVKVPTMAVPKNWNILTEGTVGEFDHSIILEQYLSKTEADELAPHWRGGQLTLIQGKRDKDIVLLYASEWDSPEAARRMFQAYRQILSRKWKRFEVDTENGDTIRGRGDEGFFRVVLEGSRVTSIEGANSESEIDAGTKT
jgi:hypothetical protein